jgi:hypothetical protein
MWLARALTVKNSCADLILLGELEEVSVGEETREQPVCPKLGR